MLFGKYKNNLSSLTYESYIEMLKKSELKSNKGIAKTVSKVEDKYFQSEPKTFVIVIYSKKWNAIICDDANTAFVDSIKVLSPNEKVPDLKRFIKKQYTNTFCSQYNDKLKIIVFNKLFIGINFIANSVSTDR